MPNTAQSAPSTVTAALATSFEHLGPDAIAFLNSPLEVKVEFIQRDKFIEHPSALKILTLMMRIFDAPRTERPRCAAIIGATNTGKTAVVGEFIRLVENKSTQPPGDTMPLIVMNAPARCTAPQLELELADVLEAPVTNFMQPRHVSGMIRGDMRENRVRMLIIQEFNHVLGVNAVERKVVFDTIKNYTNRRYHVVLVATPEVEDVIRQDPQFHNRFRAHKLHGFLNDADFRSFLMMLEREYPFPSPSKLWSDNSAGFIYAKTKGVIGEIVSLCNAAAVHAAENNRSCIEFESLEKNLDYICV